MAEHTLVLLGRFPGKDRAVAAALARDFGRDDAWGIQVVGAAPIILIDGMTAEQAQAVHSALADVEAAGSRFEVQPGVNPELAKLSWPAPARIKGKLVSEFGGAAAGGGGAVAGNTATLIVPCPYTGQKMKLTITVSVSRNEMNVAASASPMAPSSIPAPRPLAVPAPANAAAANAAYRPIPTPVVSPAAQPARPQSPVGIPIPAPRKMTPASGANPQLPQPIISGLDSLEELTPMEPAPVAAAPAAAPRAIPAPRPVGAAPKPMPQPVRSAPLPDVPILHNQPASPVPMPMNDMNSPGSAPMPVDLLSAPMDLSAFEAKVSASGIMRAVQVPAAPPDPGSSGVDGMPDDDGSFCSVSIGKSASPKVHQLVAELQGISVAEAARLCQKPIVTLAKDITVGEARGLKQQFAAVNVVAKITRRS